MAFEPICEANFAEIMKNEVEPFLASLRKNGKFASFDGKDIYYEYYLVENAKANLVVAHGFTESAEKFREVYYYFIKEGYNIFSVDHRGHGNSYRIEGTPNTVKLNEFTDYVKDLNEFVLQIVETVSPDLPKYLYSHSMGGAIAIRYLEDYPDTFKKAILSSPMVCANTGMPESLAMFVGKASVVLGFGNMSVPGRCHFCPEASYLNSNDTSKERFDYYQQKKLRMPMYRTAGPSFNWVNQAMLNTEYIIKDENIAKIKAEVLMCQPEIDKMVLPSYQYDFIKKVANGKKKYYKGAKHEIYNSPDEVLLQYYPDLFEFLK